MPEGDTVHLAAERLDSALTGKILTKGELRVPRFATADLGGRRVLEVVARGKHLLFRFDDGITLHTHFKMEGTWHIYKPGQRWRGPAFQVRALLDAGDAVAVGFRLGITELVETAREEEIVGYLGPDPLGEDWDVDEVLLRLESHPDTPIGDALIDQSVIAGPGNIYRCEVCFLRGLHPSTRVRDVDDLRASVDLLARLMAANRTTGMQITTGDARPGRTHWVYGRGGEPCRRCGTPIERQAPATTFERVTYRCPNCQPSVVYTAGTKGSS